MRTIKFRAWDKKRKEMLYDVWPIGDGKVAVTFDRDVTTGLDYVSWLYDEKTLKPSKVELMQFTGLKDKNGKEIYEGDLVEWEYLGFHTSEVSFKNGMFFVINEGHIEDVQEKIKLDFPTGFEVIGNIYENGDLLK